MNTQGNAHVFLASSFAALPNGITVGDVAFDTSTTPPTQYYWNGTAWTLASIGSSNVTISGSTDSLSNWIVNSLG